MYTKCYLGTMGKRNQKEKPVKDEMNEKIDDVLEANVERAVNAASDTGRNQVKLGRTAR